MTTTRDPPLEKFLTSQPQFSFPTTLVDLPEDPKQPNLMQMFKNSAGKEIYRMPLPVELLEPTVENMKRAEEVENSYLLDEAAELPKGSLERLLKVAAYAMAPAAAFHTERVGKPLFSMPGETLEVVLPEKGVRYIVESFQDDGWSGAAHMEGRRWVVATDDRPKPKLWANSLDFQYNQFLEVTFDDGDVYTWSKGTTSANNTVTGPMFMSHSGKATITQHSTNRTAVVKFTPIGTLDVTTKAKKASNRPVEGYVTEGGKKLASPRLKGFWDSILEAVPQEGPSQVLWKREPIPEENLKNWFQMPPFVVGLSKIPEELKQKLPPTDSRLRTDYPLIEQGKWKEAQAEKERIEKIGFANAAPFKDNGKYQQPKWFIADPKRSKYKAGEGIRWRYNNRYWAAREAGFAEESFPDIFGEE